MEADVTQSTQQPDTTEERTKMIEQYRLRFRRAPISRSPWGRWPFPLWPN